MDVSVSGRALSFGAPLARADMPTHRRPFALAAIVVWLVLVGTARSDSKRRKKAPPPNWKATVTVVNKSDWEIHELHLSHGGDRKWGPDRLGADVLAVGGSIRLTKLDCDWFDVKLVDQDGNVCVVEDVDLCLASERWVLTSDDLQCERGSK